MKEYKVIVNSCGDTCWYKPGTNILHRENGPAIEYSNGDKAWCINGKYHREDGPAIEYSNGDKAWWFINGKLHREDGPAVEYSNGKKAYYLNGIHFSSKEDYEKELAKRNNSCANKVVEIDGKKYNLVEI